MDFKITNLTIEHYQQILDLWKKAGLPHKPVGRDSKESMEREMKLDIVCFYGVFHEEKLIAVSIANYDGRRGWINRLAVDPDYQKKGLGKKMITYGEQFLRSFGATVICGLIEENNSSSRNTFEKNGYSVMREILYYSKRDSQDS